MYAVKINAEGIFSIIDFPTDNQLPIMQDAVGGWIERVGIVCDGYPLDMWVNEEGLLKRLPYNSVATYLYESTYNVQGLIVGDVIITGGSDESGDTLPLTLNQATSVVQCIGETRGVG